MKINCYKIIALILLVHFLWSSCNSQVTKKITRIKKTHQDIPFIQDFSVKYNLLDEGIKLKKVFADRNGDIKILSTKGLLKTRAGQFLYPGELVQDKTYRAIANKKITDFILYKNQFVYLAQQAIFSNAWAGKLFCKHHVPDARILAAGKDFSFLISNGKQLQYLKDSKLIWETNKQNTPVMDIKYDPVNELFWILTNKALISFSTKDLHLEETITGTDFTCFEILKTGRELIVGTTDGYLVFDTKSKKQIGITHKKLPNNNITSIVEIDGKLWFGSTMGAFMQRENGQFNYYFGKRWLPDNQVIHIAKGVDQSVLILTQKGLGIIHFETMTLADKAIFYDKQIRSRHIRLGFNASLSGMKNGDISTGFLSDSDNDGLWTSMYLGGEAFRYAVTNSADALQNCRESLDAMERLYTINPVAGFPSRSFERSGIREHLAGSEHWLTASDPEWDWKSTTSSDEAIGHIFVFGVLAELVDDTAIKKRAIHLIDILMQHIVDHDFYLVDYDGKPTTWGRWNPEYVNARPKTVGDRKLNSSNVIAMLQTAYHFTKKEIYKEKAFELMDKYGYLENLLRPMKEIGHAPDDADDWSKMLSEEWNHSDDEMYFLGYWGLYKYAFNDDLKKKYKRAILDHWQMERPEKEGLWNIFTAIIGDEDYDLEEAVWYLQEYPLDLITWNIRNSHRNDIEKLPANFREQFTQEVLPPDELPISRHNSNRFRLDGGGSGDSEYSAGDIWTLAYWMARYLGLITANDKIK